MEDYIEKTPELNENLLREQKPHCLQRLRVKRNHGAATENDHQCISNSVSRLEIADKRILSERTFSNENVSLSQENSYRKVSSIIDPDLLFPNNNSNVSLNCPKPFCLSEVTKIDTENRIEDGITMNRKPLAEISLTSERKTSIKLKACNQKELVLDEILDKENIPATKSCSTPEQDKIIVYSPQKHLEKLYDSNGLRAAVSMKEFYDLLFDYRCLWQEFERLKMLEVANLENGSRE